VLQVLSRCQESLERGGRVLSLNADETEFFVHETATIDEGAVIGERSKVWHYTHVMGNACIGVDCVLGQNVFVAARCDIGNRVKIQNNVSIYQGVTLEDDVFCGPSMVFTNVRVPRAHIERKHAFETTRVGRGASLGANSTVVCGNDIGVYAMVGAGAVVTAAVPAHALVAGVPARVIDWVCSCGERLNIGTDKPQGSVKCSHCSTSLVSTDDGLAVTKVPRP
jgi:UDP-2-acetamido-3-amino-2,3-dideoxy-glucuronate N-acetyltransferase